MTKIRKVLLAMVLAVTLCIPMFVMQPAEATNVTLSLKAQWAANTDDATGYKLSCFFGGVENWYTGAPTGDQNDINNVWTPGPVLTTGTLIPIPTVSLINSYNVTNTPFTGTLTFHLVAINQNGASTPASATYNYDINTGVANQPTGFSVIKGP